MNRTELPWHLISAEVIRAINACNQKRRFVSAKFIAEHIHVNTDKYPHFKPCTYQTTQGRVSTSMTRMKWTRFNGVGGKKVGVFIDPRVKDEITDTAAASL
jgi:hypothetical protein